MFLEILYKNSDPFTYAIIFSFLTFVFLRLSKVSGKNAVIAKTFLFITFGIELYGIVLRTLILERVPIANTYEIFMWCGFSVMLLGVFIQWKFEEKSVLRVGVGINTIFLILMRFTTGLYENSFDPLLPVLRSNLWLGTHVTIIIFSYACLVLGWAMANYVLISSCFSKITRVKIDSVNKVVLITTHLGLFFLIIGVLLGALWADYSWGRFWGWDPKETWSLITIMIYLIILHQFYAGKLREKYFTVAIAGAFMSVLMTWVGVNYILRSGLHSYGLLGKGFMFITIIPMIQIVIMISAIRSFKHCRKFDT